MNTRRVPRQTLTCLIGTMAMLLLAACGGATQEQTQASTASSPSAASELTALLPADKKASGKLTVATEGAYPPFEMFDKDGKTLIGVDPELATAVAGVLGLKVELVNVKFDAIIPGLQAKRYDMGLAAFGATAERQKVVDFVTYFQGGTSLLFPAGNPKGITLTTMCGKRLAIQKGTIYESAVVPEFQARCKAEGKPAIVESVFPGQPETILAVSAGRADVTISDFAPLAYSAKQSNGKFDVLDEQYKPIPWGIALPKDSGMAKPVLAAVKKLMADGTYAQILKRWDVEAGAIKTPAINSAKG